MSATTSSMTRPAGCNVGEARQQPKQDTILAPRFFPTDCAAMDRKDVSAIRRLPCAGYPVASAVVFGRLYMPPVNNYEIPGQVRVAPAG